MHCRAEPSSNGRGKILLPPFTQSACAPSTAAKHKMKWLCRKLTPPLAAWIRLFFSVSIAGKASRAQTHWRRDRGLETGYGGTNKGRKPLRKKCSCTHFVASELNFRTLQLESFSQIRKIFTMEKTCPLSRKSNYIWSWVDFPFFKDL